MLPRPLQMLSSLVPHRHLACRFEADERAREQCAMANFETYQATTQKTCRELQHHSSMFVCNMTRTFQAPSHALQVCSCLLYFPLPTRSYDKQRTSLRKHKTRSACLPTCLDRESVVGILVQHNALNAPQMSTLRWNQWRSGNSWRYDNVSKCMFTGVILNLSSPKISEPTIVCVCMCARVP